MTVVILGGGIGGLSTAYYLLKSSTRKVILIEASDRLGGWIRSDRQDNGLVLEQGPRTLRTVNEAGCNTLNLLDELKLSDKIRPILRSDPAAKNRFIYAEGRLHALPSSFKSLFRVNTPFSKPMIHALLHDWKAKPKYVEDESCYSFVARRFGKEIADYAISPLLCGICGGNAKDISVNFLMGDLFEREQTYGSITKSLLRPWAWKRREKKKETLAKKLQEAMLKANDSELTQKAMKQKWSSFTIHGGLEVFPQTLKTKVEDAGGVIMTQTKPVKLDLLKKVIKVNEDDISFDFLVSALPAFSLASLLYENNCMLAQELQKIQYTSIITLNLVYHKKILDINGFGFLVPPSENLPLLGVIFDHSYAPHEDWTILTVMMGGHAFNTFFRDNCTEEYIVETALQNLAITLNIRDKPDFSKVSVLRDCIPQHIIGHKKRVTWIMNHIEMEQLPLFLVGNAYKGTGVNDVILSARETADSIVNYGKSNEFEGYMPMYKVQYV